MLNKPAYFPLPPSSARLHQQELQLQQYTLAAMSARERERERGRLSPEPHLEIMRPVSPFQNKRQFAHQQAPAQATPQAQPQRDQRTLNSHYQTHSASQPYAHAKQSRAQEASFSSTTTSSHSHSNSGSRSRPNAYMGDSRGARGTQRDADISPALKMMSYDTSLTPPSSEQGHGRNASNAPYPPGTLAPPDRGELNRSTSPEGFRRKNPGWRKPVPKYIPTPPSTPPTTAYERLPSSRGREEPVPPVPHPSTSVSNVHLAPVKAYSEPAPTTVSHAPPPRPARAATDHQVPVMFRDLTANLDQSRTRIPAVQQPAQVHTLHRVANALSGSLRAGPTSVPNLPQAPPPPRAQHSVVAQAPAAPQVPPQAHATQRVYPPPSLAAAHSHSSNSRPSDARAEIQRGALVHPQPKKVPSMAQLVAMVLPSRTPSPGVPPPAAEISGPSPLNPAVAVQNQSATLPPQLTVPSLSVDPPSPIAKTEVTTAAAVPRALLQPYQVQLPPSGNSSAKSSRSVSPQPSPPRVAVPLPVRSRSPTPAIIPQYAPPPPPFPPPPPNTPIAAPKPRVSVLLQPQVSSRLIEKAEPVVAQASHTETTQVVNAAPEEHPVPAPTRARTQPSQDSGLMTTQTIQVASVPAEKRAVPAPIHEQSPPSQESSQTATQMTRVVNVSAKEWSTPAPMRERNSPSQESRQAMAQPPQVISILAEKRPAPAPMRNHSQVSRESGLATPPITPPGTIASMMTVKEDRDRVVREERNRLEQPSESIVVPVTRSRSPPPFSPASAPVPKAVVRREALIQDEELPQGEERPIKETKNISQPATAAFTLNPLAPPGTTSSAVPRETPTPPSTKLPADWKETITRAVRSNVSPNPSPPVPSQVETDENSSMLPLMKPTVQSQPQAKIEDAASASAYVITGTWMEQVEHATTALELHVHEVEARRVFDAVQVPERTHLDIEKEQHLQSSRSPRRILTELEAPSTTAPAVRHRTAHDFSPPGSTLNLTLPEAPVRSRSPVPRRKAPQQYNAVTQLTQERADARSLISPGSEMASPGPSSISPGPPARQPAEFSSRSHSSGQKKRVKTARARVDDDDRDASTSQLEEGLLEITDGVRHADISAAAELQSPTSCISPPPRYQSLSSRKRLPLNGSDPSLVQSEDKELTHARPPSPPVAVRSLSPSSQTQPLSKPSRHLHGQHKRLPAPEVTQQAYRPPTPPIPSHYRKKRSNDMLPPEPPSFMKPAVHVIYPDTSTSHGHSFSGDSVLNMSNARPLNTGNRAQPTVGTNPFSYREERARPQSPSLSTSASLEQDEYENAEPEVYPQVPPKARRADVNTHGSPGSDRQSDFTIQHATRGQVRYPSAPVGQAKAHTLMLPPSSNSSRSRTADRIERSPSSNLRSRRAHQPHATKAARSQSEKVLRNKNNVQPVARSRSTPLPSSRQRNRRGFWRMFGLWARVFMAKFKTWASTSPSPSQLPEYAGYYDDDY